MTGLIDSEVLLLQIPQKWLINDPVRVAPRNLNRAILTDRIDDQDFVH